MDILKRISEYRSQEEQLAWSGTFADYLELVRERPYVTMTAHARVYAMIKAAGVDVVDGVKRYRFFEKEIFGLERALEKLVEEYFHSAAMRLDVRKRILLLMGPVSGGKSTIVTMLKRGLEQFSRTDEGAVYAIEGCPMHEEPLHLIPHGLRPEVEKELGVKIEGNLCPSCQMRLKTEYGGRIEDVRVHRVLISEENRVGIGTFSPSDPKSQDIADLTGSIDFSTITEYGSESDPRAYRFDGELNKANRGIMEFQEMLKCDEKFLWNLLSLTQEGNFKAGRFALISADELIIAHTNEAEYRAFIANKKNEALQSRMIVMPIPYNLRVSDEEKIYAKLIAASDLSNNVHIAPHALRAAAMFSVMSRLKESKKQGMDPVKKMRMYDGESVEGYKAADVKEMQDEFLDEGMSGVDPRYVINRISSALIRRDMTCINALDVLRAIKEGHGPASVVHEGGAGAHFEFHLPRPQGIRPDRQEGSAEGVRLLVRGIGEDAVRKLSGQCGGVLQLDEDPRPADRRGDGSGRAADALHRGADRHFGKREKGVPRRDPDPHVVLRPQGQDVRLQHPRAAARGDREEAVRGPEGCGEDHHVHEDAG